MPLSGFRGLTILLLMLSPPPALAATGTVEEPSRVSPVLVFHMPEPGGYGGTVREGGGLLFVQTPFPHTVYALDLARTADPVRWRRELGADRLAQGQNCCGTIDDGPALAGGHLYVNTFDGHTMALDTASGAVAWDTRTADPALGETLRTAPLLAGGDSSSSAAAATISARAAGSRLWTRPPATRVWRRFDTGPDTDVGASGGRDLGVAPGRRTVAPGRRQRARPRLRRRLDS